MQGGQEGGQADLRNRLAVTATLSHCISVVLGPWLELRSNGLDIGKYCAYATFVSLNSPLAVESVQLLRRLPGQAPR
jgi:hypothetical protein